MTGTATAITGTPAIACDVCAEREATFHTPSADAAGRTIHWCEPCLEEAFNAVFGVPAPRGGDNNHPSRGVH